MPDETKASRVFLKQRHKRPTWKKTPIKNREHIRYIATRPGVVKDPETGHGLFGKIPGMSESGTVADLQATMKYVYDKSRQKTVFFRAVLSLREADAAALGFINNRKKWEDLMNAHAAKFAEANHIPMSRFQWVGAVHMEKEHPHIHLVYWDGEQPPLFDDFRDPKVLNKTRIAIMKDVFSDDLENLKSGKTAARDALRKTGTEFFFGFEEAIDGMSAKEFEQLKTKLQAVSPDHNLPPIAFGKFSDRLLSALAGKLLALKNVLPKDGALKYAYLPSEAKAAVDGVVSELLTASKDISAAFERYLDSEVELSSFYVSNKDALKTTRDKAAAFAMKMLGNKVLRAYKDFAAKDWEVRGERVQQECVKELIFTLFDLLSAGSQQNEAKIRHLKGSGDLSKQAKIELAIEMESKGLEWERD
ncbi:MAG: relaxase MobL [Oscillospiraceae bacterium]|jgi:hypothetical protein|nr:relaxase MobL [Oscillospiraceae bacterium]